MIPGDYAVIKKLPRNRHGKVDSNSLAEVDTVSFAEGYSRAPKGDTETRIAACWAQALQNSNFGATDDFLDVGGHSLLLTSIAQFIDCEFGVRTTLSELRVNSTIAEQAHYVDSLLRSGDSIANRSEEISRLDRDRYRAGPTRH
jgi:putative non-ribosomal peptide synthetase